MDSEVSSPPLRMHACSSACRLAALHKLIHENNSRQIRQLVASCRFYAGMDINELHHGDTALHVAAELAICDSSCEVVRILLKAGAQPDKLNADGLPPIRLACTRSCVMALREAGADGHGALAEAIREGSWDTARTLLAGGA